MREVEAWHEFFVAAAGAAAALAGLVIVAISVNVERILKYPQLPPRAAATVAALVLVLTVSLAGLADQTALAFGLEVLGLGAVAWYLQARASLAGIRADRQNRRPRSEAIVEVLTGQVQLLPFLVAGALLIAGLPVALYLLLAGFLAVLVLSMTNAWVLLVEILR
ncbi:hypothetical protein [Naasia sp. SYSU D00057]|uniref:hypothetical protein n=1 Tax=Naasia sp. SYSU D00057 TaxID=2817380 RepID=UPI001B304FB1|nr:hypothetical protein [Naasia sp. SYSU D00057]